MEITEIPEIPEIPEFVKNAASVGRLVIFIGAGVSRLLGYPSWKELADKYSYYLHLKGKLNYLELENLKKLVARKLLSICYQLDDNKNIQELLKPSLNEENKEFADIYKDIYSLNHRVIFITTNFDKELDNAYEEEKKRGTLNYPASEIVSDPIKISGKVSDYANGTIIHLHGSLGSKMILTIEDYFTHYQEEKIQEFLRDLFTNYTVLFIGYGLEEYEILEFLIHKSHLPKLNNRRKEEREIKHCLLYPMFSWQKSLLKFYRLYYENFNIELVPYNIDKKGYYQLYEVIKNWTLELSPALNIIELIDKFVK
jgi:NAD-dependent SIR2 family protein deacetylase